MTIRLRSKVVKFKSLDKIPVVYLSNIKEAVNNLANNPRPFSCKKLLGFENLYRIRVNDYRIIYSIEDAILTVEVIEIGHRAAYINNKRRSTKVCVNKYIVTFYILNNNPNFQKDGLKLICLLLLLQSKSTALIPKPPI